jgi:hypothetical protein
MFAANTYVIRPGTDDDAAMLLRLAELDSQRPLDGRVLVGEINGTPAAAVSLDNGRVIANPFTHTAHLVAAMRMRAQAFHAYEATPSLRERLLAALPIAYRTRPAAA